jgi:predicted TIM-barrel enzyme
VARGVPVLAGVNATDPFVDMPRFLKRLKKMGFAGVQNFPTVGLIDGPREKFF